MNQLPEPVQALNQFLIPVNTPQSKKKENGDHNRENGGQIVVASGRNVGFVCSTGKYSTEKTGCPERQPALKFPVFIEENIDSGDTNQRDSQDQDPDIKTRMLDIESWPVARADSIFPL